MGGTFGMFVLLSELNITTQTMKNAFKEPSLQEFWLMVRNGHDELENKAMNILL